MAKILVVDDDPVTRYALRRKLETVGHSVGEAANGNEAVSLQRWYPADVVLIDIVMPVKGGIETIDELKREFPDLAVVAYTGHDGPEKNYLAQAKERGANVALAKPFSDDVLLGSIAQCC
jgi:CheY-like chemotaxis protein